MLCGGFKYCIFIPIWKKMIQFDYVIHIFEMGWFTQLNHQLYRWTDCCWANLCWLTPFSRRRPPPEINILANDCDAMRRRSLSGQLTFEVEMGIRPVGSSQVEVDGWVGFPTMVCCFLNGAIAVCTHQDFFLMGQLLFEQTAQRKASRKNSTWFLCYMCCTLIVSLAMFFVHLFPEKQIEEQAMMEQTVHSWRIWDDLWEPFQIIQAYIYIYIYVFYYCWNAYICMQYA